MRKTIATVIVLAVSLSASQAFAGGWGKGGSSFSSGLVNVSPSVNLGNVTALNGIGVLNGAAILSGNNVSGILNGNANGVLSGIGVSGILSGIGVNILGPNKKAHKRR